MHLDVEVLHWRGWDWSSTQSFVLKSVDKNTYFVVGYLFSSFLKFYSCYIIQWKKILISHMWHTKIQCWVYEFGPDTVCHTCNSFMNLNYLFHAMNFTSNYSCNFLLGVFLGVVIINDLLFSVLLSSLLEEACF